MGEEESFFFYLLRKMKRGEEFTIGYGIAFELLKRREEVMVN